MSEFPDITQRSIIAAARKRLDEMQVDDLRIVSVHVPKELSWIPEGMALDGPQDWDRSGYIVDFRRVGFDWEPIEVK